MTLRNPMNGSTSGFYPSLSPRVCSNSCPFSWWCHLTISSSVTPFSCPQPFPASGSFQMSRLFPSGGQSIGASASATPWTQWKACCWLVVNLCPSTASSSSPGMGRDLKGPLLWWVSKGASDFYVPVWWGADYWQLSWDMVLWNLES